MSTIQIINIPTCKYVYVSYTFDVKAGDNLASYVYIKLNDTKIATANDRYSFDKYGYSFYDTQSTFAYNAQNHESGLCMSYPTSSPYILSVQAQSYASNTSLTYRVAGYYFI